MQVVDHIIQTEPRAFFLFDPTALNNQCHLFSLLMAQKEQPVDRRFFYHLFILSHAFVSNPKLQDQICQKALREMSQSSPNQELSTFLKHPDTVSPRLKASRVALGQLFMEHMQKASDPELRSMLSENLQLETTNRSGTVDTIPKFAGVSHFLETLAKENIPLVFKVKVITPQGTGTFSHCNQPLHTLPPETPVVVVEMMAPSRELSFQDCVSLMTKCPSFVFRSMKKSDLHPESSCLFCTENQVDVTPYQQDLAPVLSKPRKMLLALAADFVCEEQKPFVRLFTDTRFPKMMRLFHQTIPKIGQYKLSRTERGHRSVFHVYPDCASEAAKPTMLMNGSYNAHVANRGIE